MRRLGDQRLERRLLALVSPLMIRGDVAGDPVQPGLGARLAPEAAQLAVDDQEDILGGVVQRAVGPTPSPRRQRQTNGK